MTGLRVNLADHLSKIGCPTLAAYLFLRLGWDCIACSLGPNQDER
jgi:hypothetical protein